MPNLTDWIRLFGTFTPLEGKQVDYVDFQLAVDDAVIRDAQNQDVPIYFTDIQFQPGNKLTGWVPETREMLAKLKHTNDETSTKATANDVYQGPQPQTYPDLETRWFSIVGRGHSVITIPNYLPEEWSKEILPTGVDFTLYPKEDFDLMRISTSSGVLLPEEDRHYKSIIDSYPDDEWVQSYFPTHPLHYRYTREFWVDGAAAGTDIKIHASTRLATSGGADIPIAGQYIVDINGSPMAINRKRFMLAPRGSVRFRVEFYKQVPIDAPGEPYDGWLHLKDTGIGFYGTAEFSQWTYGRARI